MNKDLFFAPCRPGRRSSRSAGPAHPEIRLTTERGETIEFPQGGLINQAAGNEVVVLYHPDSPRDAAVDAFGARYGFAVLSVVGRSLLLASGLVSMRHVSARVC